MADFYQTGVVTTLHRLTREGTAKLERELESLAATNRIGLVLPALWREFEHPAMRGIVRERWARYASAFGGVLVGATSWSVWNHWVGADQAGPSKRSLPFSSVPPGRAPHFLSSRA